MALDPRNNMPLEPEQQAGGQRFPLSTHRVESVIPKGDHTPTHQKAVAADSASWMYPSESMFFNAMKRKGWQPREEDMRVVLQIHNAVNDKAWSEVMRYEALHEAECDWPKLARFMGKPKSLSPKARVRSWMGYKLPFDRHDWQIDRCGTTVRYVIDFYEGAPTGGAVSAMHIDARPALDSWGAAMDRLRMQIGGPFGVASSAASSAAAPSPATPSASSDTGSEAKR